MHIELEPLIRTCAEKERAVIDALNRLNESDKRVANVDDRDPLWYFTWTEQQRLVGDWISAQRDAEDAARALRVRAIDVYAYPLNHPPRACGTTL